MKEKTIFITCDGKKFENEDDAIEYESNLMAGKCKDPNHFVARDYEGNVIDLNDYSFGYIADNAFFIDIKTKEASTAMSELNESGLLYPDDTMPTEIGHFRWDDDRHEWRELLDDLEELNELWAPIGKKFEIARKELSGQDN